MWTINITERDDVVEVRASRWATGSPYPAQLFGFQLLRRRDESELGLLQRIGRGIYAEAAQRATTR